MSDGTAGARRTPRPFEGERVASLFEPRARLEAMLRVEAGGGGAPAAPPRGGGAGAGGGGGPPAPTPVGSSGSTSPRSSGPPSSWGTRRSRSFVP